MAGKGDRPRPVDGETFRRNYDMIFPSKIKPHDDENKQQKTTSDPNVENGWRQAHRLRRMRSRFASRQHRGR
jgi:hypothetical protein